MDERVYWIWMQHAFGAGSRMPWKLAGQYPGGVKEFCEGGPRLWNSRRDLTDGEAAALRDFSLGEAEARLEYAEKVGWQVISPGCEGYPRLLENIPDPPAALYCKGTLPDVDRMLSIAVVGSRKPLPVSESTARHFGYQLAIGRACVVSGGAVGIDAAALSGALQMPGSRVISVLPVSLDSPYILENARLRSVICEHGGALVTEYFSQQRPGYGTFQARNRLITGLSRGVVIIQARKTGGGPIYAARALEQDRDVFVYPGPEGVAEYAGSRKLIEDGAKAVTSGEDLLAEYEKPEEIRPDPRMEELFRGLEFRRPPKEEKPAPVLEDVGAGLSPGARQVWEALERNPLPISRLEEKTGLPVSALLRILTELELDGLAQSHPGKRYSRPGGNF